MASGSTPKLPAHELRRLSVAALTDPRTVSRALAGGAVRRLSFLRIQAAIRKLGLTHLLDGGGRAPSRGGRRSTASSTEG